MKLPPVTADGLPAGFPSDHDIPTVGWDFLAWSEEYLAQPDGERAGEPWLWTPTQARVTAWWHAVQPKNDPLEGQPFFRRGQIVLPKGAGKSPWAAALGCGALLGPCLFDGWDSSGEAVGKPHPSPHVQIAAVSEQQTENTYTLITSMLRDGEAMRIPNVGLDIGATRVLTRNGLLRPVTASATSREGQRVSDAIMDEPHLWTSANGGKRLAATIRRNLGKTGGRSMETTNCWIPGELSVAEETYKYWEQIVEGILGVDPGLMRYHPTAPVPDLSDEKVVRAGLEILYHDSPWINIDRILAEVYDRGTTAADARRFYLNQLTSADDGWMAGHEWAGVLAVDDDNPPFWNGPIKTGDTITLGFDGSRKRSRGVTDASALIGCRVSDGHLFELGVWEQPEGPQGYDWEAPREIIDAAVHHAFKTYRVVGFYADPAKWESHVAGWEAKYGSRLRVKSSRQHPIEWWMTGGRNLNTVRALDAFLAAVIQREISHDGAYALTRHALNARVRNSPTGVQIAKAAPDSPNKIDAVVAAVLAFAARTDAIAVGIKPAQIIRVR